jgi:hypothetical protein
MLDNRRRQTAAQLRWAHMRTTISMVFMNPVAIVFPAFILMGVAIIAARELKPHAWPGTCYEAQLGRSRLGGQMSVCVKHIPFAAG